MEVENLRAMFDKLTRKNKIWKRIIGIKPEMPIIGI